MAGANQHKAAAQEYDCVEDALAIWHVGDAHAVEVGSRQVHEHTAAHAVHAKGIGVACMLAQIEVVQPLAHIIHRPRVVNRLRKK
jgi:hypothetical protein